MSIHIINNRIAITSLGRALMIVRVVISKTTRVPATSFSLSTLLRQPTTYLGPLLAFTITEATKANRVTWTVLKQKASRNKNAFNKSFHFLLRNRSISQSARVCRNYVPNKERYKHYLQRSLSRGLRTSPIIWPTL